MPKKNPGDKRGCLVILEMLVSDVSQEIEDIESILDAAILETIILVESLYMLC